MSPPEPRMRGRTRRRCPSPLDEVTVVLLRAVRIGGVAGGHDEPRGTLHDLVQDRRLIRVLPVDIDRAPIAEHREAERRGATVLDLGAEPWRPPMPQQADTVAVDPVAVTGVGVEAVEGTTPSVFRVVPTTMVLRSNRPRLDATQGLWLVKTDWRECRIVSSHRRKATEARDSTDGSARLSTNGPAQGDSKEQIAFALLMEAAHRVAANESISRSPAGAPAPAGV